MIVLATSLVDIDYEVLGKAGSMLVVRAAGTAASVGEWRTPLARTP
jgi:hypothetical protein